MVMALTVGGISIITKAISRRRVLNICENNLNDQYKSIGFSTYILASISFDDKRIKLFYLANIFASSVKPDLEAAI